MNSNNIVRFPSALHAQLLDSVELETKRAAAREFQRGRALAREGAQLMAGIDREQAISFLKNLAIALVIEGESKSEV